MARTPIVSGPLKGHEHQCTCRGECVCEEFSAGAENGNHVWDGYVLYQRYVKRDGVFHAADVWRKTMIGGNCCPRCGRAMPDTVQLCKNCGALMGIDFNNPPPNGPDAPVEGIPKPKR